MRIGMVGLGRMGANMATRLIKGGHEVVVFDVDAEAVKTSAGNGPTPAASPPTSSLSWPAPRRCG